MPAAVPAHAGIPLSEAQQLAWLRLIRSENVGPVTFRELINHFGTAAAALEALPDLSRRAGRRIRVCSADEAAAEYEGVRRRGATLVTLGEPAYPPWLRQIDDAPPVLTVHGTPGVLTLPMVAVVGSRNASVVGRKFAMTLARGVGDGGYAVASGLARGIDAAAHEAALAGGTVAVFAGGVDHLYPAENAGLAERIVGAGGALVSEMPLGWEPRARDFPRRNRIVSGLALGVLIVEAAERSGSLITARFAAEQGRLVFAVPGSPLDPRAAGANRLIKGGATLVTEARDILEALAPIAGGGPTAVPEVLRECEPLSLPSDDAAPDERAQILEALSPSPTGIDEIIRFTGARPAMVHLVLIELDLAGRLERHPGGRVSLI